MVHALFTCSINGPFAISREERTQNYFFFRTLPKRVKISEETVSDDGAVTLETSCGDAATGKLPQQQKHKTGYSAVWERQHSRVFNIEGHGMYCKLCQKFDTRNRQNQSRVWNTEPCTTIRKDVLMRHEASMMHKEALEQERACQLVKARRYQGVGRPSGTPAEKCCGSGVQVLLLVV